MPRLIPLVFLFLIACAQEAEKAEPAPTGDALTGLYERVSAGTTAGRICITGQGSAARFGLVTIAEEARDEAPGNCSARGALVRQGSALTLAIDGAPACTLRANATAGGLTLTTVEGPECAYYCGAGVKLEPGAFVRAGTTEADARKAVDIAAEPLCP